MSSSTSNHASVPKHKYPGLGLPVRYYGRGDSDSYPIGAHSECYGSVSDIISVREVAMMDVMEKLTDKKDWNKKVFDDKIVDKWRDEALTIPDKHFWDLATRAKRRIWVQGNDESEVYDDQFELACKLEHIMDEPTFWTCVQELRSKARYFEQSGIIPTLDVSACVAKSDTLVTEDLHRRLCEAFEKLKLDHAASPDWHPKSNSMVQDLVHPSMYPLVYGRSRGFQEENVGVADAVEQWAGKGEIIPRDTPEQSTQSDYRIRRNYVSSMNEVPPEYWSDTYQWLPANVAFQEDGSVRFTSYVNNLHPTKYPDIYRTIEMLIGKSIPMWDQVLRMALHRRPVEEAGRTGTRTGPPVNADDFNADNWIPNNADACVDAEVTDKQMEDAGYCGDWYEEEERSERIKEAKWTILRTPRIPPVSFTDVSYAPQSHKRLADRFHNSGLQIIVKMASIELTPEKPRFSGGGWHVEGQMNERICATALYYLDSENISDSSLSFRMRTSMWLDDEKGFNVGQDRYHWLQQNYGTHLGCGSGAPTLQNYGEVQTRQGRLLTFPNDFQHRVSPFQLTDPTKPGHRRFIALWLVDPTMRVISTANIPPQQMDWYIASILGTDSKAQGKSIAKLPPDLVQLLAEKSNIDVTDVREGQLPKELLDWVRKDLDKDGNSLPMSLEEAEEHRLKLMQERSAFVITSEENWQLQTYSFCEH